MQKVRFVLLTAMVCALLALCGCKSQPAQSAETVAGNGSPAPAQTAVPEAERDWEPIDTKFGTLCYPDQWMESLETEQTETDDAVQVMFRARIGEQQFDLFQITVGAGEGESAGTLTGPDDVKRDVYVQLSHLPDLSETGLNEGEIDRVYAMQEAVNEVLAHLA